MKSIWSWVILAVVLVGGTIALHNMPARPGKLDTFATCIKDSGAQFFGAFWCPHCQNQKAMFGNSAHLLPYTECSTPDGSGQLKVCTDKGVKGYPTWFYPDGTSESGEISLSRLAEKTQCELPAGYTTEEPTSQGASSSAITL